MYVCTQRGQANGQYLLNLKPENMYVQGSMYRFVHCSTDCSFEELETALCPSIEND